MITMDKLPFNTNINWFSIKNYLGCLRVNMKNGFKITHILPILCVLCIFVAPLLASGSGRIQHAISDAIYQIYQPVCHQLPQRSWQLGGYPLAVCIRCTVFYFSGLLIVIFYYLKRTITFFPIRNYILFTLPTFFDIIAEMTGLSGSHNSIRVISAVFLAFAFFHCLLRSLASGRYYFA
jgi:uncharacterized membrane protein